LGRRRLFSSIPRTSCLVASNDQRDRTVEAVCPELSLSYDEIEAQGPGRAHLTIRQANVALNPFVWLIETSYD
jgi:hypothetical protein